MKSHALDFLCRRPDPQAMTSTLAAGRERDEDGPLRPLLARIWRDYLQRQRAPLTMSLACAGIYAALTGELAWLLNPAIHYLFPAKHGAPAAALHLNLPWGGVELSPGLLVWLIPVAVIVGSASFRSWPRSTKVSRISCCTLR